LVLTFRWRTVTALTLNRQAVREVTMTIDRVVGGKPLSVRRYIIKRTDSVPLFVDEMTSAVQEAESAAKHAIAASNGRRVVQLFFA
jgi:hypothetical protein